MNVRWIKSDFFTTFKLLLYWRSLNLTLLSGCFMSFLRFVFVVIQQTLDWNWYNTYMQKSSRKAKL